MKTLELVGHLSKVASDTSDPDQALDTILAGCVSATQSSSGSLYRLDFGRAAYKLDRRVGGEPNLDTASIAIHPKADMAAQTPYYLNLRATVSSREYVRVRFVDAETEVGSQLVVPILRGKALIGLLSLWSPQKDHFSRPHVAAAQAVATVVLLLYETQFSLAVLRTLQLPIDFYQSLEGFFEDLLLVMAEASGMPSIVLREFDSETSSLRCIATYGFPQARSDLDISPLEQYPPFYKAVHERHDVIESDLGSDWSHKFRDNPELAVIGSFVCVPVLVGTDVFGTLSFAASFAHVYSSLEVAAFQSISNAIGTMITNYRNVQHLTAVQISWAEQRRLLKTREKASPKGCSGDQVAALDKIEIMLLSQLGLHSRQ